VAVGPRFSQSVLQTLLVLVNRIPPHAGRKLLIIGTSSRASLLESLEITQVMDTTHNTRAKAAIAAAAAAAASASISDAC
jgi:vesicle-fusing ATPase